MELNNQRVDEEETAQRRTDTFLGGNLLHLVCSRRAYDQYLDLLASHDHHYHRERFAPGVTADIRTGEVERDQVPAQYALIRIQTFTASVYHVAFVRADLVPDVSKLQIRRFVDGLKIGCKNWRFTHARRQFC